MLGLVELLFVFAIILAWGLFELRSLRRSRRQPEPAPHNSEEPPA